jgi:hypothetical protein
MGATQAAARGLIGESDRMRQTFWRQTTNLGKLIATRD